MQIEYISEQHVIKGYKGNTLLHLILYYIGLVSVINIPVLAVLDKYTNILGRGSSQDDIRVIILVSLAISVVITPVGNLIAGWLHLFQPVFMDIRATDEGIIIDGSIVLYKDIKKAELSVDLSYNKNLIWIGIFHIIADEKYFLRCEDMSFGPSSRTRKEDVMHMYQNNQLIAVALKKNGFFESGPPQQRVSCFIRR